MHGAKKVKNISQYSCASYRTLFSDYPCSSAEYAVQQNHRHMNILASGKIILILAESCVLYFIVIIFRIITTQQIQYNEIKKATCTAMDIRNNTPVVILQP